MITLFLKNSEKMLRRYRIKTTSILENIPKEEQKKFKNMKVRITSKTYYMAETEDGKKYSVDIRIPAVKKAFDNNEEIEGDIHREEKQDRYTNGEYARSYTVIEKFVPKKDFTKISLTEEVKNRVIPSVPKEERSQLNEGYEPKKKPLKISLKKD